MSTFFVVLIIAAVVVLAAVVATGLSSGRPPLFRPRRGDQPTPDREGAARSAAPDVSSDRPQAADPARGEAGERKRLRR